MSETKILHDYGTVQKVVKLLRQRGDSERVIRNVLRVYGLKVAEP